MDRNDDLFDSSVRPQGDFAGVFEYDGETGFFYLCRAGSSGNKVLKAVRVVVGPPGFTQGEVTVKWGSDLNTVGLLIRGQLWAAFDVAMGETYGGDYQPGAAPMILREVRAKFEEAQLPDNH